MKYKKNIVEKLMYLIKNIIHIHMIINLFHILSFPFRSRNTNQELQPLFNKGLSQASETDYYYDLNQVVPHAPKITELHIKT